jgi:hypothetical protein
MTAVTHFPNIEAAEKVMQGMEDGLRAALPQLGACLPNRARPGPLSGGRSNHRDKEYRVMNTSTADRESL